MEPKTCGYYCYPATNPGDGDPPFDCSHDAIAHYDIDGEATGCTECEQQVSEDKHREADTADPLRKTSMGTISTLG